MNTANTWHLRQLTNNIFQKRLFCPERGNPSGPLKSAEKEKTTCYWHATSDSFLLSLAILPSLHDGRTLRADPRGTFCYILNEFSKHAVITFSLCIWPFLFQPPSPRLGTVKTTTVSWCANRVWESNRFGVNTIKAGRKMQTDLSTFLFSQDKVCLKECIFFHSVAGKLWSQESIGSGRSSNSVGKYKAEETPKHCTHKSSSPTTFSFCIYWIASVFFPSYIQLWITEMDFPTCILRIRTLGWINSRYVLNMGMFFILNLKKIKYANF